MVLYTAGIQLLTRIYNVLFIEGSWEKHTVIRYCNKYTVIWAFLKKIFFKYKFSWNFVLISFVNSLIEKLWFTIEDQHTFLAPVAAPGWNRKNVPPEHKGLELKEWESIVGKISNFR